MSKKHTSWKGYLSDLDDLYQMALGKENISAALKIKEIQIQTHQQEREILEKLDMSTLSEDRLDQLIALIEQKANNHTNFDKQSHHV